MENARVPEVDLGALDLSSSNVLEPWLKSTNHERAGENVQVATCSGVANAHGGSNLRSVEGLPMEVNEHLPETTDRLRWNRDAERRNVAFEEGSDERLAPGRTRVDRGGEKRERKASTDPQGIECIPAHLVAREGSHLHEGDPARKSLRPLSVECRLFINSRKLLWYSDL